jgi:hypothetical protein
MAEMCIPVKQWRGNGGVKWCVYSITEERVCYFTTCGKSDTNIYEYRVLVISIILDTRTTKSTIQVLQSTFTKIIHQLQFQELWACKAVNKDYRAQ